MEVRTRLGRYNRGDHQESIGRFAKYGVGGTLS